MLSICGRLSCMQYFIVLIKNERYVCSGIVKSIDICYKVMLILYKDGWWNGITKKETMNKYSITINTQNAWGPTRIIISFQQNHVSLCVDDDVFICGCFIFIWCAYTRSSASPRKSKYFFPLVIALYLLLSIYI